jgi:hypothetical protein
VNSLNARYILKKNIKALLQARGQDQKTLAFWCRKKESWISQFLTKPERGLRMAELDRVAEFFGLEVYQLFLPGISTLTERRSGRDRRSGVDRRVSHVGAILEGPPTLVALEALVRGAAASLPPEQYRRFYRRVETARALEEQGLGAGAPPDSLGIGEPARAEKQPGKRKRRRREA